MEDGDADDFNDGYVSNKGNWITIHIKPELYTYMTIDLIKEHFAAEADDSWDRKIVEFLGWEAEIDKH